MWCLFLLSVAPLASSMWAAVLSYVGLRGSVGRCTLSTPRSSHCLCPPEMAAMSSTRPARPLDRLRPTASDPMSSPSTSTHRPPPWTVSIIHPSLRVGVFLTHRLQPSHDDQFHLENVKTRNISDMLVPFCTSSCLMMNVCCLFKSLSLF